MSKSDVIVYHDVSEIRRVELLSKDYLLVLYFLISSLLTQKCLVLTSTQFESGISLTISQPQKAISKHVIHSGDSVIKEPGKIFKNSDLVKFRNFEKKRMNKLILGNRL